MSDLVVGQANYAKIFASGATGFGSGFSWSLIHIPTSAIESSGTGASEISAGLYVIAVTPATTGDYALIVSHTALGIDSIAIYGKAYNNTPDTQMSQLNQISADVGHLRSMVSGRWKIANNRMTFYDEDNTTVVAEFDLFGKTGQPAETNVFERVKL